MPAGSEEALRHLYGTIINPVSKEKLKSFLSEKEFLELEKKFNKENVFVWGFEPGKINNIVWKNLVSGDVLIFVPSKEDLIITILKFKTRNPKLAEELWGPSERSGQFWEMIVFIEFLVAINLEKREFLDKLRYSEKDVLQGSRDVTENFSKTFEDIEEFIKKFSKQRINLEFYRNLPIQEMMKRGHSIGEEIKALREEIPKLEKMIGIGGITPRLIEEKKKRLKELLRRAAR